MENLAFDLSDTDSIDQETQGFSITDDGKAEWAIKKIREARADTDKWREHFDAQLAAIAKANESTEAFFTTKLAEYFASVPKKETKTQQKYCLPSGDLIRKKQLPEYQRDNEELLDWLESNAMEAFIERKSSPKWAELKKACTIMDDGSVVESESGEIIRGVVAIPRPDKFEVKITDG